ncbi:MAG: outer membrane lipid asymmetry maintenance protein MlaD, partial [Neisseriales bacterium]
MKRSTIDFWVGIFVVIGLACIVFLSLKVANITSFSSNSNGTYTLYAKFS